MSSVNKTIYDLTEIGTISAADLLLVGRADGSGLVTAQAGELPAVLPLYTNPGINLISGPYSITTPGVYWAVNGTDANNYLLTLPNPGAYLGQQIILVNGDPSNTVQFASPGAVDAGGTVVNQVNQSSVMTLIAVYSPQYPGNVWLSI